MRVPSSNENSDLPGRLVQALAHCISPRNWPELAERVARNPQFFVDLLDYAQRDAATSSAALQRMISHLRMRAFEGHARGWIADTIGFPKALLAEDPWLADQLRATPHFGAIRAPKATRWDYALLVNAELLRFKKEFAGFGLGCSAIELPSGITLTGLELTQCWSLLSSAGHLFGTFATERAILFELFREPTSKPLFLAGVAPELRPLSEAVLDSHRLIDFYYALTSWRISRVPMTDPRRADLGRIWAEFLRERAATSTPSPLLWSFRSARRLAYNRLHTYLGVGPPVDVVSHEEVTRAMSPWRELGFEPLLVAESSLLAPLLDAADAYQWEHHFAGPEVAADVLAHVRSFRRWWKKRSHDLPAAIDALFAAPSAPAPWCPPDWQPIDHRAVQSFARLKIPRDGREWLEEVSEWLAHDEAWSAGNFLVAPRAGVGPGGGGLLVDVYTAAGTLPEPLLLRAVATRLATYCEQSWGSVAGPLERELWRSITVFGLKALALLVKPTVRPMLHPVEIDASVSGGGGHVGYGLIAEPTLACARAKELTGQVKSRDRRRELLAAASLAAETASRHAGAPMLLLLGSTLLVDADKANKPRAEFDGVWAFFERHRVTWYLLEHKRSDNPTTAMSQKLEWFDAQWEPCAVKRDDVRGKLAVVSHAYLGNRAVQPALPPNESASSAPRDDVGN